MIYTDLESSSNSKVLTRATISVTGSQVTIDCEFAVECPLALCVLIYREYNNSTLTVIDYSPTTLFPVSVNVDQPEKLTLALFGRNCDGVIEEMPAKRKPDVRSTLGRYSMHQMHQNIYVFICVVLLCFSKVFESQMLLSLCVFGGLRVPAFLFRLSLDSPAYQI